MSEQTPETDSSPLTRLQIYCSALYNYFDENSEVMQLDEGTVKIWRGYTTQACGNVEIPEGVRNRVIRRLEDVGSIQLVERGRRNTPSVVVLLEPPTAEVWERDFTLEDLTARPDPAILSKQITDIHKTLGGLPLAEMFKNIEERLKTLEDWKKQLESGEGQNSQKPQ